MKGLTMDIVSRITKMKAEILIEITKSAKAGDTSAIVSSSAYLQTLERCQKQAEDILRTLDRLERGEILSVVDLPSPSNPNFSNKKKGEMHRNALVNKLQEQGIDIHQIKGVRYCINPDLKVGIAFASEVSPDKWWLGLPRDDYYAFVLICKNEKGSTANFIFPRSFYEEHASTFSVDANGQVKFNIRLRNNFYCMKLPGQKEIYLTEYVDAIENLQVPAN